MPAPQLNGKSQTRERPTYTEMLWEQLQDTKAEVKETRKELNQRIDRLETRIDRIEARVDKLDRKLDALGDKADTNRRLLPNISTVDLSYVGIALGVMYALFLK